MLKRTPNDELQPLSPWHERVLKFVAVAIFIGMAVAFAFSFLR